MVVKAVKKSEQKWSLGACLVKIVYMITVGYFSMRVFFLNSHILGSSHNETPMAGGLESFMNLSEAFTSSASSSYSSFISSPHHADVHERIASSSSSSLSPEDRFHHLPQWMQDYFTWHKQQTSQLTSETWQNSKFLILGCRIRHRCGGLSDRMKPLPLFILIANRTQRIFFIHWDKPAPLEKFLQPPLQGANWSMPEWMVQKIDKNEIDQKLKRGEKALTNLGEDNTTAVYTQLQDFHGGSFIYDNLIAATHEQLDENNIDETAVTDMKKAHSDRYHLIYHDLFRYLFEPSPPVAALIDEQMKKHNLIPGEYSIAHYRAFYAKEDQKHIFSEENLQNDAINVANCGSELRPGGPVYFASDSKVAVEAAVAYGKSHNRTIVAFDGPEPVHIEKEWQGRAVSEFYSIFVDLYLMGNGRCVAFGRGGFGRYALMMGFNSTCELRYVYKGRKKSCHWTDLGPNGESLQRSKLI
ncbi:MAG: hypothetical protein SGBAC_000533 [Bacillariaceae sp.]